MSIRIVSYNILVDHHATTAKPSLSSLSEETRRTRLVDRVTQLNPDIICLQEVENFDKLAALMHKKGYWGIFTQRNNGEREGCATFYNNRRFEVPSISDAKYFNDGTGRFLSRVILQDKKHELPPIVVHNSHVAWDEKRRAEIEAIAAVTEETPKDAHVIICGDFNASPSEPALQAIRKQGFLDSLERRKDQYSFYGWDGRNHTSSRIDFIFGRNMDLLSSWTDGHAEKLRSAEEPSDHLPVYCDYRLPSRQETASSYMERIYHAFSSGQRKTAERFLLLGFERDASSHSTEASTRICAALYSLVQAKLSREQDYFGCAADIFLGRHPFTCDTSTLRHALVLAQLSLEMDSSLFEKELPHEIQEKIKWAVWVLEGMPPRPDFATEFIKRDPSHPSIRKAIRLFIANGKQILSPQVKKDVRSMIEAYQTPSFSLEEKVDLLETLMQKTSPLTREILSAVLARKEQPDLNLETLKTRISKEGSMHPKGIIASLFKMDKKIAY